MKPYHQVRPGNRNKSFLYSLIMIGRFILTVMTVNGCVPEPIFLEILGTDDRRPLFLDLKATSANCLELRFSESVTVQSLRFSPALAVASIEDGQDHVLVAFNESLVAGGLYALDVAVQDLKGNGLHVLTPFRGHNDRVPKLRLMEIRTEYSKPKVEFAEFLTLTAGSLGGVRLVSATQGFDSALYEFPPCEVAAGERIVVHLRSLEAGCIDELFSITAASATEASALARDFWVAGSRKLVRKSDIVALLDQNGCFLDAVLFLETTEGDWKNDTLKSAAAALLAAGAWHGRLAAALSPADAVASGGLTPTRTLCRLENSPDNDNSQDWYVCATSAASPGLVNSPARYEAPVN